MAPSVLSNPMLMGYVTTSNEEKCSESFESPKVIRRTTARRALSRNLLRNLQFEFSVEDIVWKNVVIFVILHFSAFYGIYLLTFGDAKILTFLLSYSYGTLGGMGITAGAHRLWAHRAYKAKWQLRLILAIGNLIAFQNCIYEWVRDHRVHHKFTDTNADPHNSRRGFFFSHMGWLLLRKHPDIKRKGATIDMSDLERDSIVMFQKKYYGYLMPTFCFIIPALLPHYLLNETLYNAWFVAAALRYVLTLHATWLVNSAAHKWGTKPIDRSIAPTNNAYVALAAFVEGWHNYHHIFPWDYKTSELGDYSLNLSTAFIDFFAKIGWAYDLKTVSKEMIERRAARTGDGSRKPTGLNGDQDALSFKSMPEDSLIWGWDDPKLSDEDKKSATILNQLSTPN